MSAANVRFLRFQRNAQSTSQTTFPPFGPPLEYSNVLHSAWMDLRAPKGISVTQAGGAAVCKRSSCVTLKKTRPTSQIREFATYQGESKGIRA